MKELMLNGKHGHDIKWNWILPDLGCSIDINGEDKVIFRITSEAQYDWDHDVTAELGIDEKHLKLKVSSQSI